jgi:hypothetical protein
VEGSKPVNPISIIRRKCLKRIAVVALCYIIAFTIFIGGSQYTNIPSGYLLFPSAGLLFFSMAWHAFSNLDFVCPRCSYNLIMDLSRPGRAMIWYLLFYDPYVCPNCKLNLSEPYPGVSKDGK